MTHDNTPNLPVHSWREILVEYSLDAVVGINSQSLIIDWNLQAEKIFGWKREEAIGKVVSSILIPPEFREAHHQGILHYLKTGVGPILNKRIELQAIHSSGNRFSIELTVSPIHTENEILFYSFVRDITERKRGEDALKAALREKDEFISICSHELKTPITSMKLQFQIAKRMIETHNPKVFQEEEVSKRINITLSQIAKMTKLIEDMLDVGKVQMGKLEQEKKPVEMNALIEETCSHFTEQFEVLGIETSFKKSEDAEVYVLGDAYRLEQALSNLITNAVKYGEGKLIHVALESSKDEVHLMVTDEGKGIAAENLEKIFMRYTRLEPKSTSGLGIGLYITKNIVEGQGGTITVESKLGHGSTFTIKFPRH